MPFGFDKDQADSPFSYFLSLEIILQLYVDVCDCYSCMCMLPSVLHLMFVPSASNVGIQGTSIPGCRETPIGLDCTKIIYFREFQFNLIKQIYM